MAQADIGLIGLAVMGENLVLNMESRGYTVAVFNRTVAKVDELVEGRGKGKKLVPTRSLSELVASLKKPRKIMMMVKAGPAVDELIKELVPLLSKGDILIDGGNTYFPDTNRRTADAIDHVKTRINCITGGHPTGAMVPVTYDTDREAVEAALQTIGLIEPQRSRVMQITNTLHVGEVLVSEAYKPQFAERPNLTVVSGPSPMAFDSAGNLADVHS